MISYTVSFTLHVPDSILRDVVEKAVYEANKEFHLTYSTLFPVKFSVLEERVCT